MNYVGIDHHRQYSHMTLMDEEGQTIRSGRVSNLRVEIEKFLEGMEAVWPSIRADYDLRCFFERLARAKGANKAKVIGDNSAALRNSLMDLRRPPCLIG